MVHPWGKIPWDLIFSTSRTWGCKPPWWTKYRSIQQVREGKWLGGIIFPIGAWLQGTLFAAPLKWGWCFFLALLWNPKKLIDQPVPRWWFYFDFWIFTRNFGEDEPNLRSIFFGMGGSTTKQFSVWNIWTHVQKTPTSSKPNLGSLSLSTMGFMKINMKSCPPF